LGRRIIYSLDYIVGRKWYCYSPVRKQESSLTYW
jgi:hypothetical protein